MALEYMKIILQDVWKSVTITWESFIDVCNSHVGMLEDKIFDGPADETRAPELWANSSMWLKVERLVSIHSAVVKETQANLRELTNELATEDNWLEASIGDMERLTSLVQEDLVKPTTSLTDLMYKSVEIRDSRHSLQLNTSLWRLSWVTFIFLPLTFMVGFFGMNVDTFSGDPSIKWYFVAAVPLMVCVLLFWFFIKHFLARRRQTPYQRGIYEDLFHELATRYPSLWSRNGPRDFIKPKSFIDRLKWRLVLTWNSPGKTIKAGSTNGSSEYDELSTWSRCKRKLTRRWTSQIRNIDQAAQDESTNSLEEGVTNEKGTSSDDSVNAVELLALPALQASKKDPSSMLEVPQQPSFLKRQGSVSPQRKSVERPGSAGSSGTRNSGVIVEEEKTSWLRELAQKGSQ